MTFKNEWFEDRQSLKAPPLEAVLACSASGPVDEAVAYWVSKLNFDGPAWFIREYLSGFGAWDKKQLCDHQENLQRLFWSWCCDLRENEDLDSFCGDGEVDQPLPAVLYLGA